LRPYYEHGGITIYHGDCLGVLTEIEAADVCVTDPPYGISLQSSRGGRHGTSKIANDHSTAARDQILSQWAGPAIVFGSPKVPPPPKTRHKLIWDKTEGVGMGDLRFPWKPNYDEIHIIGDGFKGKRTGSVLRYDPKIGVNGRQACLHHPTEKPLGLMKALLDKCPADWIIIDPFMGSGTTLVAAKQLGRRAIGIEIEEKYCEIAAKRLAQENLPFGGE